jgi:DNA relaxase NicK
MIRFDAYSATTTAAKPQDLVQILVDQAGVLNIGLTQGKGFHTFGERIAVKDSSGSEYGSVMWGGRQGERCMFEVKGERTPGAVQAIRAAYSHRVTRVDACADFDESGAFEALLGPCIEVKKAHRLKGSKAGDWDDFPEDGRTLYLGSTASAVRVRLYEKGKQPEYRHLQRDNWARIEVQARPAKEHKSEFAHLSPADVWGASTWTRELAARVLAEHIDPHPAGTTYRLTERDRALQWMCKQYGPHLFSLAQDLGGWDCVGLTLREMIGEARRKNSH